MKNTFANYETSNPPGTPVQKLNWTVVARYDSYDDAKKRKEDLEVLGEVVKIHRMGVGGREYGVKVASPLKKVLPKKESAALTTSREPAKTDKKARKAREKKKQ